MGAIGIRRAIGRRSAKATARLFQVNAVTCPIPSFCGSKAMAASTRSAVKAVDL